MPRVVSRLQGEPQLGTVAAKLAEPHGHFGADRGVASHHSMERLAAYSQKRRDFADRATPQRRQDIALKQYAGMSWRSRDVLPIDRKFLTHKSMPVISLVILL